MHLVDQAESPQDLEILLGIDSDDNETLQHLQDSLLPVLDSRGVVFVVLEFQRLGYHRLHEYLNSMVTYATGDWLIFYNDDAVMQTQGWDQTIRQHDGEFRCLAFDTHRHHPYSIWPIVPREWIECMGTVSNHHMFDAVISQIAYLLDVMERTTIKADHERFDLVGGEADETAQQKIMFEGNPQDPRDINHANNRAWRQNMAEKLSLLMASKGINTDFWQKVKQGTQDPWVKLRANDINNQMLCTWKP